MPTETRWTIDVSADTDQAVREFLAESGQDPDSLAGFVEESVRWRLFDADVQRLKARNADLPPADLEAAIDAEVAAARADRRRVTGDKSHLLALGRTGRTRIVTARQLADSLRN